MIAFHLQQLMIIPSSRTARFHYAIRNIVSAAEVLERSGRQVTYLNIGDPQAFGFRPPGHVVEAVQRALKESFTGYAHSTGMPEARETVAAYATRLGASTTPDQVIITAGASEAADLILTALLNQGDEALIPAPGYPLYPAILSKLGAEARYYRLNEKQGWQPSIEEVRSLITKRTRALVLINPNNPTGSITPDETTRALLNLAAEHNLLVIADEVYRELCFGPQPTPASVIAEAMAAPLITLESLSKTHMLPGWRIGWMRFTHAEKMRDLITAITRLASGRLCSPTPAQYAVRPALEGDRSFLDDFLREIRRRRDLAIARVKGIEGLSCTEPQAAFYMMIRVDDPLHRTDERFVLDLLEETGVLVVHGSGFGNHKTEGYFRLVYLADEATLDKAFEEMNRFLKVYNATST
jgi:aspartate/methionine/tyrosine aminotransferase